MPSLKGDGILLFRPSQLRENGTAAHRAFTIFVDAMFTTLLEALFTKAFDVISILSSATCVLRGGRSD